MRRALITTVGIAGLAATVLPVLASPGPVDEGRTAAMQVTTKLPSGDTLQLEFKAVQASGGAELVIDTTRCDADNACITKVYAGDLPTDALTISASDPEATLHAVLDGRALSISWKPAADGGYSVGGGTLEGDGPDTFASEYFGTSADTTVTYDGLGCQGTGGVGNGVVIDTATVSGTEVARPLNALQLPDGAAFHC